jgi:hypothetical protein
VGQQVTHAALLLLLLLLPPLLPLLLLLLPLPPGVLDGATAAALLAEKS